MGDVVDRWLLFAVGASISVSFVDVVYCSSLLNFEAIAVVIDVLSI